MFVVGQSPCCMPPPPHSFNLRAFANTVPLPRMLPTSLPPPNLLKAHPSSPLSGRCPSLLSWEPTLESFIICSFQLFSDGFTCDNYVCPTSLGDLWDRGWHVAHVCTHPHWHTLHGAWKPLYLLSYCPAGTRQTGLQHSPSSRHFASSGHCPFFLCPWVLILTTIFSDKCLSSFTVPLIGCPTLGKALSGSPWPGTHPLWKAHSFSFEEPAQVISPSECWATASAYFIFIHWFAIIGENTFLSLLFRLRHKSTSPF